MDLFGPSLLHVKEGGWGWDILFIIIITIINNINNHFLVIN